MKRQWTEEKAINHVIKNGRVDSKKDFLGNLSLLVLRGSVGNGTLGAIDFLNNKTHVGVNIVEKL